MSDDECKGYNCAAEVAGQGGWRYHACGKRAKVMRCGAPLCGVHALAFDRNHELRVLRDHGKDGRIRMGRPEHGTERWEVEQYTPFSMPHLVKREWEGGASWERASDDKAAVLREYIGKLKAHRDRLSNEASEASTRLTDAQRQLEELKQPG